MNERVLLIEHSLALLLLFTAVGSGPAVWLIKERDIRLATMPILGFALTASFLTSLALVIPVATATWAILLPIAAISFALAVVGTVRRPADRRLDRTLWVPVAAIAVAMAIALTPPVARGTQGPFALNVYDAWGYAATSAFLEQHEIGEELPAGVVQTDVVTWNGANNANSNARIGVDAVNAATASLFRIDTGAALAPLLAALYGLVPLVVWLLVVGLGGSWRAGALGAAFGLTPAMLSLVDDTALGNLAGEVLAAPILLFLGRSIWKSWADAVVAGALLGGLLSVYPEFLPPLLIIAAAGGLVAAIARFRGRALRQWIVLAATRMAAALVSALAIAPNGSLRAFHYLSDRTGDGPWAQGLPLRYIDEQNVGAWGFGVLHLYEMGGFSDLSFIRQAFAMLFPVLLAGVVVFAIVKSPRVLGVFVAAPIVVTTALGLFAFESFQSGRCEYCLWKSLTLMLPFLAAGLAFGFDQLWAGVAKSDRWFGIRRLGAAGVVIVALVALGYSDFRLTRTTRSIGAFCPAPLRDLGDRLEQLPTPSPVLIEGAGSMPKPVFMLNAAYFTTRNNGRTVLFDAGFPAISYLVTTDAAPSYYSPEYSYVITPYTDVASNRTRLGSYGPFALERRGPIDVVVSYPEQATDNKNPHIPWVSKPFNLRIASTTTTDAAITFTIERPLGGRPTFLFRTAQGQQLEPIAQGLNRICINIDVYEGETGVVATPVVDPFIESRSGYIRKELGIAAIRAVPGRCAAGR